MQNELQKIKEKCLSCQKCSLCKTRTNIVFDDGFANPKLMLIGENSVYYHSPRGVDCASAKEKALEKDGGEYPAV